MRVRVQVRAQGWAAIAALSFLAPGVQAHSGGASYVELSQRDAALSAEIDLPLPELAQELTLDADADGQLRWGEVLDASPRIIELMRGRLVARAGKLACRAEPSSSLQLAERQTGRHLRLVLTYDCGDSPATALDASQWLLQLPDHGIYVHARENAAQVTLLSGSQASMVFGSRAGSVRFVQLGVLHLVTGYDHLAFLLLLLLAVLRPNSRGEGASAVFIHSAKVVTAFTLAHSVTLALAATGAVRLPAAPVEAAIAVSIIVTALALLWQAQATPQRAESAPQRSWLLAFGFGLVHGLGFANVLAELISGADLASALLAFNLGIELAQIGIVIALLPLLVWLARTPRLARVLTPTLAVGVGLLACGWLAERV